MGIYQLLDFLSISVSAQSDKSVQHQALTGWLILSWSLESLSYIFRSQSRLHIERCSSHNILCYKYCQAWSCKHEQREKISDLYIWDKISPAKRLLAKSWKYLNPQNILDYNIIPQKIAFTFWVEIILWELILFWSNTNTAAEWSEELLGQEMFSKIQSFTRITED